MLQLLSFNSNRAPVIRNQILIRTLIGASIFNSGAPARAGGASIRFGGRQPARIRPGASLSLSLIWSPSLCKNILDSLRVNFLVEEICKNTVLLQSLFIVSHVKKNDLDISFQFKFKQSDCMKRQQNSCHVFHLLT